MHVNFILWLLANGWESSSYMLEYEVNMCLVLGENLYQMMFNNLRHNSMQFMHGLRILFIMLSIPWHTEYFPRYITSLKNKNTRYFYLLGVVSVLSFFQSHLSGVTNWYQRQGYSSQTLSVKEIKIGIGFLTFLEKRYTLWTLYFVGIKYASRDQYPHAKKWILIEFSSTWSFNNYRHAW